MSAVCSADSGSRETTLRVGPLQPVRAALGQLRAGGADDQQRRVRGGVGDPRDEIEESGLGPVDVLEHDDQGPSPAQSLEQLRAPQYTSSTGN